MRSWMRMKSWWLAENKRMAPSTRVEATSEGPGERGASRALDDLQTITHVHTPATSPHSSGPS